MIGTYRLHLHSHVFFYFWLVMGQNAKNFEQANFFCYLTKWHLLEEGHEAPHDQIKLLHTKYTVACNIAM